MTHDSDSIFLQNDYQIQVDANMIRDRLIALFSDMQTRISSSIGFCRNAHEASLSDMFKSNLSDSKLNLVCFDTSSC